MITRYRLEYDDLDVYEDGNLVKYEDHQREVAQLQARVAELEAALSSLEAIGVLEEGLIGDGPEIEAAQKLARKALGDA